MKSLKNLLLIKWLEKIGSVAQKHKIKFFKFIKLQIFGKEFVIILCFVLILKNLKWKKSIIWKNY